jgi:dihydrofolate synthase/folylpolyglutamate synthase
MREAESAAEPLVAAAVDTADWELPDWLAHAERLHHRPIDLSLDRVRTVARVAGIDFTCPAIVVGGTNGKGSTCAMLESILRAAGYRTGLYLSPHLLRFNERACIDGVPVSDAVLVEQLAAIEARRAGTPLTYFEFTTLAILRLLAQRRLDVVVLEIGLGGRFDAVNLVDGDAAIVTSIDLDHMEFLGPDRDSIGFEKAHIFRAGRPAICADPQPPQSLLDHAAKLGADLWRQGRDYNFQGDRQQWAYGGRRLRRNSLPYPALRGANQLLNASAALAALEALADRLPVSQQAVRQGLLGVILPARFQVMPGRPAIVLDVAHNPHAAAALAHNLDQQGFFPRTFAVFSMLRDKDIGGVVAKLDHCVDDWLIAPLPGPRGSTAAQIEATMRNAGLRGSVATCDDVAGALRRARDAAGPDDRILVFGSFLTVAAALQVLQAPGERRP